MKFIKFAIMFLLLLSPCVATAGAILTVTVVDDNGPVNGHYVTVKAWVWDRDRSLNRYITKRGFTGNSKYEYDGEQVFVFNKNVVFSSTKPSIIICGGPFSRKVVKQVRLFGFKERVTVHR
ncbi:MAG: hypothetical protein KAX39_00420 [candidate division Zixibacteria bacterium]|nr:hypothetical protein [candidate division Zixibacteria bacterium]